MRLPALFLLFAAGLTALRAQEPNRVRLSRPEVQREVVGVVSAQLAAFRADEWEKAYALAARSFQNVLGPDAFTTLITRNYTVVWKNTRSEFGVPSDNGRVAIVPVRVFSGSRSEAYNWLLMKEGSVWRVTGVVPQHSVGA